MKKTNKQNQPHWKSAWRPFLWALNMFQYSQVLFQEGADYIFKLSRSFKVTHTSLSVSVQWTLLGAKIPSKALKLLFALFGDFTLFPKLHVCILHSFQFFTPMYREVCCLSPSASMAHLHISAGLGEEHSGNCTRGQRFGFCCVKGL